MAQDLSSWAGCSKVPRHEFVQELSLWKTEGYEQNSITLVAMLSTDSDSGESAASAACGMDGEVACRGSWTSAQPPSLPISTIPAAPSLPAPLSTMPMTCLP